MQPVLLIDEIDKADIEFPNDLLRELDRMEFYVYETRQLDQGAAPADHRHHQQQREGAAGRVPAPLLLPLHPLPGHGDDGAHRRACTIPDLKKELLAEALTAFFKVREVPGLKKKPSTSELLDWIKLLLAEDIPPEALRTDDPKKAIPPLYGALLKNEQDVHLFEQLVFLHRRAGALSRGARATMLDPFFFKLREAGVPVSITEFLTLLEALEAQLAGSRAPRISTTCRAPAW